MTTTVTAVVVGHDGDRWLPVVLDALASQTRRPDHTLAVDTGSTDRTPALLREALGDDAVLTAPADTGFGDAVTLALGAAPPDSWVWLLHDDAAPAPDALEQLLAVAAVQPSADLLGPKTREWPSLRRLLEVGVTISGTGRRETGLERGEYDQGQHDQVRDVLAVTTAGLLVRRSVLEALRFDPRLPVLGADLDLGWRAARAGHRVVVVPEAVVFHVEAAHRDVRGTPVHGSALRVEREAALYTLLVNGPALWLPLRLLRLLFGTLVRCLGLLLVRAPGEALDELAALGSTYARPWRVVAGRRERRAAATVRHREVRHLLAPWWLPYRHGLDFLTDLATAVAHQVADVRAARRERVDDEGAPRWLVPAVFVLLVLAAGVAARGLVGSGMLAGGALLPSPGSALDWWHDYLDSWHDIGVGSSAPAAPYLLPLAVLGTLLLGSASLLVDVVFLLAVPLAAWGGYRFLRRVTGSVPASLWGAVAYAVLPVVTGAVQQGRLGTVAACLVLPWLAHAALFLGPSQSADRRARASWRTALWLAVLVAFVPVAWPVALVLAVVALVVTRGAVGRAVVVPLLASLLLLLPWSVATWSHRDVVSWLTEAGLPAPALLDGLSRWDVLLGRPGGGAPLWLSAGVLVAALAALLRPDTRRSALLAWTVLVVALGATAVLAAGDPRWLGFTLVLAQAAAVTAAATAATGLRGLLGGTDFGWRQPVGVAVLVVALLSPVASLLWWASTGSGDPLDRRPGADVPAYMSEGAAADQAQGVLLVRGSRDTGFRYLLLRRPALQIGDDAVLPTAADQQRLTRVVGDLAAGPEPADVAALRRAGVEFVFAAAPADPSLAGNLDGAAGFSRGSPLGAGTRAWQVEGTPSRAALTPHPDPWRPWLLAVQGLAIVVVAVLAVPGARQSGRTRR